MTEPYNHGYEHHQENSWGNQDDNHNNHNNYEHNHQEGVQSNPAIEETSTVKEPASNDSVEVPVISYEAIQDNLIHAPSNTTAELKFSEKDMYRAINLIMLLSNCDDDVIKWVENILGISGNDHVRRSMNIINLDRSVFNEQEEMLKVMKSIMKVTQEGSTTDAFKTVIDIMNTVDSMTDSQRDSLLRLNRQLIKSSGAKFRISSKKTSNSSEIAQDLHRVLTEDEIIPRYVEALDGLLDTIRQIVR